MPAKQFYDFFNLHFKTISLVLYLEECCNFLYCTVKLQKRNFRWLFSFTGVRRRQSLCKTYQSGQINCPNMSGVNTLSVIMLSVRCSLYPLFTFVNTSHTLLLSLIVCGQHRRSIQKYILQKLLAILHLLTLGLVTVPQETTCVCHQQPSSAKKKKIRRNKNIFCLLWLTAKSPQFLQ